MNLYISTSEKKLERRHEYIPLLWRYAPFDQYCVAGNEAPSWKELCWYVIRYISCFTPLLGVSSRTQEIYLIVFVARYLDLFWLYVSLYNTRMLFLSLFHICM